MAEAASYLGPGNSNLIIKSITRLQDAHQTLIKEVAYFLFTLKSSILHPQQKIHRKIEHIQKWI